MARKSKSYVKFQSNPVERGDRGFTTYDPVFKANDSNGRLVAQVQPILAGKAGPKVSIALADGRIAFASHNPEVLEAVGDFMSSPEGKAFLKAWKAFRKDWDKAQS